MRATLPRWLIGLSVAVLLGGAPAGRAQSTAPALTACQIARLRTIPRWELDYSYQLASDFAASGSRGSILNFFRLRDWTYMASRAQGYRLVLQVAGTHGQTECSRTWPCVAQHPASLTVSADVNSESLEGMMCRAAGCSDEDACYRGECGGGQCGYSEQRNIVTPFPSAALDGTPGQRVTGELVFDYGVNPPTMTRYFGGLFEGGAQRVVIGPCFNATDHTSGSQFGAFTVLNQYPTSGGDTAVRLVNGKFVVQGQASGSDTRMFTPEISDDPQHPASFPRTWTGSASWTLREAYQASVALVGIEVNQAVQDWQQSVPLITNKPTVVRAHVQPVAGGPILVEGRLRGFRDGQELAGSPLPLDSTTTTGLAANLRRDPTRTLDWVLPPTWLEGDVELCVESPTPLACQEPAEQDGTTGDCSVRVSFAPGPPLRVKLVAVRWGNPFSGFYAPAAADLDELEDRLAAIYPTARLNATRGELRVLSLGKPDLTRVNGRLDTMRLADCAAGAACDRTYYGVLKPSDALGFPVGTFQAYGLANGVPGTVSSGIYPAAADDYARHVHAHEIGHVLGRPHAVDPGIFGTDGNGNPQGPCSEVADAGAEVFPFFFSLFGNNRPTLGPLLSGEASKVFGVDTHWDKIISPTSTFELMGYCAGNSSITGNSKWISSHTYTQLRTFLESSWFGGTPTPAPSGAAGEVMLLRGTVDESGGTAELLPVLTLPAAHAPAPAEGGTYALELRAADGTLLASTPLTPLYAEPDAPGAAHDATQGSFVVAVPGAADAAEVRLLRNGSPKATRRASAHRPTVTVRSPNGGETLGPGDATLAWDATDEDGDPLTFFVQWSRDGGATWETLGSDWTERTLEVDSDVLAGTTTARLRVVASDGFLTAVDESDTDFTVAPKPPRVVILPPTGTKPIVGAQAAVLRGVARDAKDGLLPDTALRWRSDLSRFTLGTGGTLVLEGTALAEGTHTLTLEATDTDGLTGRATVPLIVVRQGPVCGDGTVDPGEVCDDGNLLGADECSADCLTSTATSTTSTTIVGPGQTTTTLPVSSCPDGCEDGDPCTDNGCVAGVGCVSAVRTGLAGASCHCAQATPAECGGVVPPRSLSRPVAQACQSLEKLDTATGKAVKKLKRRAGARLRKGATVAAKLGKRTLPQACAAAWQARLQEAGRNLALVQ